MARARRKPAGPTAVDSITHGDKRPNIPTADAYEFVDPAIEEVRSIRHARDESLDPQLVWRGKYPPAGEGGNNELVTDAPPIYIQEKIDPRVLVENLRRTAARPEDEPELTLFDTFDGLGELDRVEFYQHDANWSNRMILGDSLQVMSSLADRERLRGKVQMIYIDPPYGIKFGSNWQVSARKRDVKDGKLEDAAREAEQIKAFRDTWELGIHSYLSYLRDRLVVARDLLTESGSCFVQIGDENVHLVRIVMDEVFGSDCFCAHVAFQKAPYATSTLLPPVFDTVLWYAKSKPNVKYRQLFRERDLDDVARTYRYQDGTGEPFQSVSLVSPGATPSGSQVFAYDGRAFSPPQGSHWKTTQDGLARVGHAGRLFAAKNSLRFKSRPSDFPVAIRHNIWTDTITGSFTEEKSYVVQTAPKVIERCMLMCTDPGDLVLDPTCGSGTTAYVAEQWGRRWITMDTSRVALALARQRLMGAKFPYYLLADSASGRAKEQELTARPLPPAEVTDDIRLGFVYERVQHITLKSIANNPDIVEGMSREEIDAAIKRHADFESLYDRPHEDKSIVRVTGPFTVESLSPHRALSFGDTPQSASEARAEADADSPAFEQTILGNLTKAGIQNGRRKERITFASFEVYPGRYIQAIGEQAVQGDAVASRVALAIGPQYGTVSPWFVKAAAREAFNAEGVDLLAILGFAFDPQVTGLNEAGDVVAEASDQGFASVENVRKLGRVPVLMVRMNADLLMGEELKKTGTGNLFTVFGEPDIEVRETDAGLVVDLRGVDVYDPTTGEIRSNDTGQIALWMIDTDYNEESFFVRHCYFTGGNDPYKRLKAALKVDIDANAWSSLYQTVSRPFPKPEGGRIAVKVINDYGDEVMKVIEV